MKKKLFGLGILFLLCFACLVPAFAAQEVTVFVNGEKLEPDVPPYINQGRVMLPARAILEPMGAQFTWDGKTQTVTIFKGARKVTLVINKKEAVVNGVKYPLDAPAAISQGRTFVPVRFVAEIFDSYVGWNAAERTVQVISGNANPAKQDIVVTGYYFDSKSLESLQNNIDIINDSIHFSYELNAQGRVQENVFFSQGFDLSRMNGQGVEMLVFCNDRAQLKAFLDDFGWQQTVIEDIFGFVQNRGFSGVNLDFEYVDITQASQYVEFVKALRTKLGSSYFLSLSVPARTSERETWYDGYDYAALAAVADRMMIMAYDQHYKGGEPGPVAGNDWVEKVINYLLPSIPREKFQLGLGIYGYDWPETGAGKTLYVQAAQELAASKGVIIQRDAVSGVSWFNYQDESGAVRQVWFEDAASVATKMELVKKYQLSGVAIWRLGIIPPDIWEAIRANAGNK